MYAYLRKHQRRNEDREFDIVKMICAFVNPEMSKKLFTEPDVIENTGFLSDVMKMDPNFDMGKYKDLLEEQG